MVATADDIRQLNEKIQYHSTFIDRLRDETARVIIGQHTMLDRLLIGLLSNGHVLLEGVPGLAKPWQSNRWHRLSTPNSAASSLHPICSLPT